VRRTPACAWILCVLLAVIGLTSSPAGAQTWVAVGPPGGNVRALAADPAEPRRVYLGTADGLLYRSDDGGAHWARLDPGFPMRGRSLDAIVVGARGTVFVGYWEVGGSGGGVARSNDGGRSFAVLKGIDHESVRALALAPSNPAMIAAGTLTGVFASRDAGRSWKRITPENDPDLRNIESLAFDPTDPRILYAGTWHLAWKTRDAGATWVPVHRGMIDDSDVMTLTVDHRDTQTIYATACTGVYRSTKGAVDWMKLEGIPYTSRRTRTFAMGDEGNLLLAGTTEGLWVSENAGGAWRRATPKELVINALLLQPDGTIVLGTEEAGILRSADRGRTWTAGNAGFSERFVSKILFDRRGRRVFVAAWGDPRYGGVFASSTVRGPWVHLGDGLEGRQVTTLALLGDTLIAGTDDGLFARDPEGSSWTRLPTRLPEGEVHPYVTDLFAARSGGLLAATRKGLFRSTDGGRSWLRPLGNADEILALTQSPDDASLVLAATANGVFRSEDRGETWQRVSEDLRRVTPHRLIFVSSEDRTLLATTSGGLFRSGDRGETWQPVTGGIPQTDLTGIAVDSDGRTIYASDFGSGGIFRSTNRGLSWKRMPIDGLASDRVWTLSFDPRAPEQLLVAPASGGLHLLAPAAAMGALEPAVGAAGGSSVATP
jgi:photosystem II stability/assembly factor-like uncharacterized protein